MFSLNITYYVSTSACTRNCGLSVGGRGDDVVRVLGSVRGGDRFAFFFGSGGIGMGGGTDVGMGSTALSRTLTRMLGGANCSCRVVSQRMLVGATSSSISSIPDMRRGRGTVANVVGSMGNRPVVNTGIIRGNAAGNAIASVRKEFSLGITPNTALMISCVKCAADRVIINGGASLTVDLGRSSRVLSRIIIINCKAVGGGSLANTITTIGNSSLTTHGAARLSATLRNTTSNIAMAHSGDTPKTATDVRVQNIAAVNRADPLIVMSKVPKSVGRIGPRSMRDVSILGSTTSTSVCNSHTTTNIVMVAAGHTGRSSLSLGCGFRCN